MQSSLAGALDRTPLEQLLKHLATKRLRGTLVLRPEGVEDLALSDVVILVDGMPAKIRTAEPIAQLGEILRELGAIDEGTHAAGMRALERGTGLLGEILLHAGKINRPTLKDALRLQLARKLAHLFALPITTRYAFYDGVDALGFYGGAERLAVDVAPIIVAGVRAYPRPHVDTMLDKLGGATLRLVTTADLSRFSLLPEERDLVGLLRMSPMSIEQLEQAGVADVTTARSLVYSLLLVGQLEAVVVAARMPALRPSIEQRALDKISSAPVVKIALKKVPSAPSLVEEGGGDGRDENVPSSRRRRIGSFTPFRDDPRINEVRLLIAALASKSHHEVLGVAPDATAQEIENAFVASATRWHPDALPEDLADLRADCELLWARIAEAHRALMEQERRARTRT